MEKIFREKLLSWFAKFHAIPDEQLGFAPSKSTLTNLVVDRRMTLSTGKSADIVYMTLLKPSVFGGYLSVNVGQTFSPEYPWTGYVPQKRVLLPLPVIVYTTELSYLRKTLINDNVKMI